MRNLHFSKILWLLNGKWIGGGTGMGTTKAVGRLLLLNRREIMVAGLRSRL